MYVIIGVNIMVVFRALLDSILTKVRRKRIIKQKKHINKL